MLLAVDDPTLLGLAAIATSLSGIISTWYGFHRTSKETERKANEECAQKLREARQEGEEVAQELHELKMKLAKDDAR